LGYAADAPSLHTALAEDPDFFVEMIGYLTPTVDDPDVEPAEPELAEQTRQRRRALARQAHEVFRSWRRVPGAQADGVLDVDTLKAWVHGARAGLTAASLLPDGDVEVGRILSRLPADPGGTNPPVAVRDLLEDVASDEVDQGLVRGVLDRRSMTTRGSTEGGAQERQLAEDCRTQASGAAAWPRTRTLLRELRRTYEVQAQRAEDDAELRRRDLPG